MLIYGNNEKINCKYKFQNINIITSYKIPVILLKRLMFLEKRFLADWDLCRMCRTTKKGQYIGFSKTDKIDVQHYNKIVACRNKGREEADKIVNSYGNLKDLSDKEFYDMKSKCQNIYTEFQFSVFGRYVTNGEKALLIPKGYNTEAYHIPDLWDYKIGNYNAKILSLSFIEYQKILEKFETITVNEKRYVTINNRGRLTNVKTKYLIYQGEKVASFTK